MRADINTIARKSGVSKATVSRVFTGKKSVSPDLKERVLRVAKELNYTPQQVVAREVITIVVYSLKEIKDADGFRSILLLNLVSEITYSGFLVNIIEAKDIDKILSSHTKAVVFLLDQREMLKYKEKINDMKLPRIAIANVLENCHNITFDYYAETALAVEHLIENGHKKISIVLDDVGVLAGKERLRGYNETMKKHKLSTMPTYSYCHGRNSLLEHIATILSDNPTAMIICGESLPNEATYALNLLRVKVPNDLSVISFEKRDSSRWFFPPHTTIDQNLSEIVTESMQLIKEVIANLPKETISKQLSCKLKIRNSVKNLNESN